MTGARGTGAPGEAGRRHRRGSLGKRPVTETEHVTGTVRREEARVTREGDVDVRGAQGTTPGVRGTTANAHEHRYVSGTCECGHRQV